MSMFTVDYKNAGDGQILPGMYEVFVSDYQISKSQKGNEVISLFYTVREDINQPFAGTKIQYDNFNVLQSSKWRLDLAAKSAGIPDGTQINSSTEWASLMVNRDLIVKVVMGSPNQQGNSYPEVKAFYPTQHPSQGRPAPILEKAYGQRNNSNGYQSNDPHRPADNNMNMHQPQYGGQAQYGGQSQYGGQASYGGQAQYGSANAPTGQQYDNHPASGYSQTPGAIPPIDQNNAMQQAANKIAQNGQQQNNVNTDNRSFANGGYQNTIDISDDDLPF
ncbi:MAG: DUF669 domain-containing protein [Enterococcus aquimarinus]|uniref:DUF669 domain-containing protein n=1 Tax=Enterococcus aquimarinus TaxID=328396 RepID=A0A9E3ZUG9_9ENTE|nr:DUF669 domain-containing protein [Enterococcus aquimarinus]